MKYLFPCILFLANDEAISLLGMMIIMGMFLFDILMKRTMKEDESWNS